jgi:outer membrane protein
MFKKIVLLTFVLIPVLAFSQESQKMAFFKYNEVVPLMPEFAQLQDSLTKTQQAYKAELETMYAEYEKKLTIFREEEEKLIGAIKERRIQEISNIQERVQTLQATAQQEQEELAQRLQAPIIEKINKVIEEVANENHFSCVFRDEVFLFHSPQIIDATPLVKTKLGLKQ